MIPRYFLYEETASELEPAFLHIEAIPVRSSRHDWTIRPHSHPDHHQILVLDKGGGTVLIEGESWQLAPTALIVVPALTVHAFQFQSDTNGFVITVASSFLRSALDGDSDLFDRFLKPCCFLEDQRSTGPNLVDVFASLEREFVWAAPGRRTAIKAYLQLIAVAIGRFLGRRQGDPVSSVRDADLVIRFRELIEQHYRDHLSLEKFARKLGVTTARLNASCRLITGRSSLSLINDRILIEAKRSLLYSGMNIAEIGSSLGFADPAYFNRFFARGAGMSPGRFRETIIRADKI